MSTYLKVWRQCGKNPCMWLFYSILQCTLHIHPYKMVTDTLNHQLKTFSQKQTHVPSTPGVSNSSYREGQN